MVNKYIHNVTYDSKYDILHVTLLPERRSYGDEYGHVALMRDMSTDEITGLVIYSPKQKHKEVINDLQYVEHETGFIFNLDDVRDVFLHIGA